MSEASPIPSYHESPEGVHWRHTGVPGALAIPYTDLATSTIGVYKFMDQGRWPLYAEDDADVLAMALPIRAQEALARHVSGMSIQPYLASEITPWRSKDFRRALSKAAMLLFVELAPEAPCFVIASCPPNALREAEATFAEFLTMEQEDRAETFPIIDPETGTVYTRHSLIPVSDLAEDMRLARARRLAREAAEHDPPPIEDESS